MSKSIYSVIVTGADRGIGLEFVKQFLSNPTVEARVVIAASRAPLQASALIELQKSHTNLHIIKLDVTEFGSFKDIASHVQNIVGSEGLTLLVNNAAIFSNMHDLESLDAEDLMSVLATNAAGPLLLTKALLSLLKQAANFNAARHKNGLSVQRAAVINIDSCCGSIALSGLDTLRPAFGYRESKAALNMSTQTLAKLLQKDGILVESIHPGHVVTEMSGPTASIDATTSVTGMLKVILGLSEKNKNGFYDWRGDVLPF